jgi:hypothetical protein
MFLDERQDLVAECNVVNPGRSSRPSGLMEQQSLGAVLPIPPEVVPDRPLTYPMLPNVAPADLGSLGLVNAFVEQGFNQLHALLSCFEVLLVQFHPFRFVHSRPPSCEEVYHGGWASGDA